MKERKKKKKLGFQGNPSLASFLASIFPTLPFSFFVKLTVLYLLFCFFNPYTAVVRDLLVGFLHPPLISIFNKDLDAVHNCNREPSAREISFFLINVKMSQCYISCTDKVNQNHIFIHSETIGSV
eukprot:TRINITY_DN1435_c4_g1_i1.p1 TRINITY_DN1435_c4_g1~~TRINITY_DN1435_c4_g1_i1.p1  ORF type:complete len:125 (+),score=1.88 TRINITY_DN1435_c4_g1_i1:46-420(+)